MDAGTVWNTISEVIIGQSGLKETIEFFKANKATHIALKTHIFFNRQEREETWWEIGAAKGLATRPCVLWGISIQ